ncbi:MULTISPECIES: hypothetical protein [Pseudonocardia]|uniref:Uncharacterized protein n=1 Tax=Pseudonocardia dioxanivorans (strain ATCC 55486 / DSM 44775 / JCM 13855 / CB1190) TaxID=675635 RepID=F4CYN9_PSEUX|nr:hypothetical protein [Pseudonocardia dioxanivorans]AEA26609.1 hypothetical protein Psed_4452 [Pseudonocardia dioxanivorans CB1190]GJF05718.1 hypothetical protein PSD17_46680 [Pseudonocardia sp. D17]
MSIVSDVLTVLAGGAGILVLLAMAALPLYADRGAVPADALDAAGPMTPQPMIPQPRRSPEVVEQVTRPLAV